MRASRARACTARRAQHATGMRKGASGMLSARVGALQIPRHAARDARSRHARAGHTTRAC
eukprot:13718536-Alexandrium_andersonii.AAC.1